MTTGSELLLVEAEALPPVLARAAPDDFDLPTVCAGWSVRDVLAHCGSALGNLVNGTQTSYSPEDNQRDVDARAGWPVQQVIDELIAGYAQAAVVIDGYGGAADPLALGEWVHGGDVREALGERDAYASAGVDLAIPLISARSVQRSAPAVEVLVDGKEVPFGAGRPVGELVTDTATFVRIVAGRRPDTARYHSQGGFAVEDLVLFR